MSTIFRIQVSRGKRRISRGFYRTTSTQGHKKPDVQEPGLRPGRGAGAEFAGRAACTPKKNIRAESVLFAFINVHPTPIVCCAAMYLGCPPPDGECRVVRSVGVMIATMDLSRLFQEAKIPISPAISPSPRLSSLFWLHCSLPSHPPAPTKPGARPFHLSCKPY